MYLYMHKIKLVHNMRHQSYILFVDTNESKQRILDAINAPNSFYDGKTEEEINNPNFQHEAGEELDGIFHTKMRKVKLD